MASNRLTYWKAGDEADDFNVLRFLESRIHSVSSKSSCSLSAKGSS